MAAVATMYNTLTSLGESETKFVDRPATFEAVAKLLTPYGGIFGLCLVHAHCTLAPGEIMLAEGNISEPRLASEAGVYHPERWLSTGEPYEFTIRSTETPPADLTADFKRFTEGIGLDKVLGLYHIGAEDVDVPVLEWTEGRRNITRKLEDADRSAGGFTETGWNLGRGDPVTMACLIVCDSRNLRDGSSTHKGTTSHLATTG